MAMKDKRVRRLHPRTNRLKSEMDPMRASLEYNEYSDTLFIYLFEGSEPLVSVPVGEGYISLLVDPESEEALGFQLDDFLERVVIEQPNWLDVAFLAGISVERIEQARERIGDARWREAIITSTLRDLFKESELSTT
jgi:hypothetical protein